MAAATSAPPAAGVSGQKVADYHAPAQRDPLTGCDIHTLRCLTSSIHLGFHLKEHIAKTTVSALPNCSTFVIFTDTNIAQLHLAELEQAFRAAFSLSKATTTPRLLTRVIPPGETSKSRETKAALEDWLLEQRVVRDATIIALGGGVIGDLIGFVAATFMRGVTFIQVPTTLLAMVDSAVGGKTAIDTPHGKNLVGAFHQPRFIFIDAAFLLTLPEREFSNGMAEVVKTAAIWDAEDFVKLESSAAAIKAAVLGPFPPNPPPAQGRTLDSRTVPQTLLLDVIRGSVGVKAHIVTIDEKETGLRNLVNFGHSIGHAIEAVLTPHILHGECISIGMILEAELSRLLSGLSQVAVGRLSRVLKSYNLPTTMKDPRITRLPQAQRCDPETILDIMRVDKKNAGNVKKIVLLSRIGKTTEEKASAVADDSIRRILAEGVRVQPAVLKELGSQKVNLTTPGSKSISNRALVLAALAQGTTRLSNLLHSDDTSVMMAALSDEDALNAARFDWEEKDGETVLMVHGKGGQLRIPQKEIYLQNAGTAARFMTGVLCLLGKESTGAESAGAVEAVITGNARMKERPIGPLVDALRANGVNINYLGNDGCLPLRIQPDASTGAGLKGGKMTLSASISSQYVSSILLCAPYATGEDVVLELVGEQVISQLYIDMTVAMMRDFGIQVEKLGPSADPNVRAAYRIPRGTYKPPNADANGTGSYLIESDASSATYPLAFAAITGTECTLEGIGSASLQGDARFAVEVLKPMGCAVEQTANQTTVKGPAPGQLRQLGEVDMETMTDAFLTAAVLLAAAPLPSSSGATSTRITGIANQRVKECNRITAMRDQLAKFGVKTDEFEDGMEVWGLAPSALLPADKVGGIHCYDDHRVAMAFSILAVATPQGAAGTEGERGVLIEEKRCVEKTWPNWWDDLERRLGIKVHGAEPSHATSAGAAGHGSSNSNGEDQVTSVPSSSQLSRLSKSLTPLRYEADATIFCIGMRASGKTYLGSFGAAALRRPFLDADVVMNDYIEKEFKLSGGTRAQEGLSSLTAFVQEKGWPAFRQLELDVLRKMMETQSKGHLISLGGGVVESPECRELLREYAARRGPVVYVVRDIEEVVSFLEGSDRPAYGEPVRDVFKRREGWFYECSSFELVSYGGAGKAGASRQFDSADGSATTANANAQQEGKSSVEMPEVASTVREAGLQAEVTRFFRFIAGVDKHRVDVGVPHGNARRLARTTASPEKRSYALVLDVPDVKPLLASLGQLTLGADAIELRVDLLGATADDVSQTGHVPSAQFVATQLAALRQSTTLPIIYTIRTKSQGGRFPDEKEEDYFELIKLGLRHAVEYVDLEVRWSSERLRAVREHRGYSLILATMIDLEGKFAWDGPEVVTRYDLASRFGDLVRLVGRAKKFEDNFAVESFRAKVGKMGAESRRPLIVYNVGELGKLSRVLNVHLTPIVHQKLSSRSTDKDALTFGETQQALRSVGKLSPRRFALLGQPIAHSLSPLLHNTGFELLGLPHSYSRFETETVDASVEAFIRSPDFGGLSVTIPHKLAIMEKLDLISEDAKAIGAVNTVIPRPGSLVGSSEKEVVLEGDNTDWIAIKSLAERHLSPLQLESPDFAALVLGAGGSARAALYAMHKLGAKTVLLYNRTLANAQKLAAEVPKEWGVKVVEKLGELDVKPCVIVSNVPADGTALEGEGDAGVVLPLSILSNPAGGVAIDMSYKPALTPLLKLTQQANEAGRSSSSTEAPSSSSGKKLWTGIPGLSILIEQGCEQFAIWTGHEAPRAAIEEACWRQYQSQQ
ncbi:hypothetical protein A4X13_0g3704 [Tilletia indica]|uniref:Pentafunctional AROM polypeptide n=1 Tax=Tilletia indica TaxID=43049 RepID=A0A177TCH0_9BASI|nr:hypothetical protein A4X13_0g3704 [Tilletia indica]